MNITHVVEDTAPEIAWPDEEQTPVKYNPGRMDDSIELISDDELQFICRKRKLSNSSIAPTPTKRGWSAARSSPIAVKYHSSSFPTLGERKQSFQPIDLDFDVFTKDEVKNEDEDDDDYINDDDDDDDDDVHKEWSDSVEEATPPPCQLFQLQPNGDGSSLHNHQPNNNDAGDHRNNHGSDEDEDSMIMTDIQRNEALESIYQQHREHHHSAITVERRRAKLFAHHPNIRTMWTELEDIPKIPRQMASQPAGITRQLKPFQREGLHWMMEMEKRKWKGGLLGDEMGLGKTIQAVSLIMSDYPAGKPSLVLAPPVALMQWMEEVRKYTNGKLKTFVYHKSRAGVKNATAEDLKKYDVIMMSYNSLESLHRKERKAQNTPRFTPSPIHAIEFHRAILDEAHEIKTRSTSTAKACFDLKATYRWCLSGTPLQNRIGEFFSLLRFIDTQPFSCYVCRSCDCQSSEWLMDDKRMCTACSHPSMRHVSVFNQELLNPIQRSPHSIEGKEAFRKMRLLTDYLMLRRLKKDHMDAMELPVKEVRITREFFGEVEKDLANSIMTNSQRKFDTYVAANVLLNNYANIFGLIMQMRQISDHPDLILRRHHESADGVIECSICESPVEDTIVSQCKHYFCRACAINMIDNDEFPTCPRCHVTLVIDLKQPELAESVPLIKRSSIINRIRAENWTSSTKIEMLLHELYMLRSDKETIKVIIFSQFTSMLQLVDWRLRHAGFTTVMLDGSMTPDQRAKSIDEFMTNVDVECFMVSLRAGGVALNLTEASRIFLIEPWWNPAVEWQSADRCHRIGQCRPCTITNLVIEDSVESRMVLLQEKKAHMIRSTINNDTKAMESLTPQDMAFLFRGN